MTKTMKIFDPAMCCSTGVCGPGVDPELIRVSTVLNNLKKNGVIVERVNLTGNPQAFMDDDKVSELLSGEGPDVLPVIIVNGKVVKTRSYPTDEEFCTLLDVPESHIKTTLKAISRGCCCGGETC